ncbi:hypothetical protein HBB16_21130 [Pseudonocardia sp. MCCB 268]|nr:hypothetical protein [Pseudonocardia cytotoxica]
MPDTTRLLSRPHPIGTSSPGGRVVTSGRRPRRARRAPGRADRRQPGRLQVVIVDGPPPAGPVELSRAVADLLRRREPGGARRRRRRLLASASVRLEFSRTDPDMFLDGWLDEPALRRQITRPDGRGRFRAGAADGSGASAARGCGTDPGAGPRVQDDPVPLRIRRRVDAAGRWAAARARLPPTSPST